MTSLGLSVAAVALLSAAEPAVEEEAQWAARGRDRVEFEVSTNPGAPFAPLTRIASGGELARFTSSTMPFAFSLPSVLTNRAGIHASLRLL